MKSLLSTFLVLLCIVTGFAQDVNASGDNSPAVIAQNFSVTYGVRVDAVAAILWVYEAEGYDVERCKRATEQILREYSQAPEKQQKADELSEATRNKLGISNAPKITSALEWDLFARSHYLSTTGMNSPAVVAKGDVNIWYGIPPKALRALATQLEKNKIEISDFETKLADQVKKYEELKTELETYGGKEEIYKQAEALLEEGKLEEAEQLIEADYRASKKRQAYKGYVFGKAKELLLKYNEAAEGYRDAVFMDNTNAIYHSHYAYNEGNLAHYDESIKHYEIALSIDSLKNGNEEGIAILINNLGFSWHHKGDNDRAIIYYEKALQINLKVLEENHSEVATNYNNLGEAWRIKGQYDKAIRYYEKALQIFLTILGNNHPNIAINYNNLGLAWFSKGLYDKAIEYYEKALQINLKALEEKHPEVATNYNNLGAAWRAKGEYDKAIEYFKKSLQINLKALGENHPHIAGSYNNLGLAWRLKGEYDKAIEYFEKALQIYLKAFGENHPDIAGSYHNLGDTWNIKGEYDKAIEYFEKALPIYLKAFGENHPDIAGSYHSFGLAWAAKRKYDKAIEYFEKALPIYLKAFGENHPQVVTNYYTFGLAWRAKGEYDKAIEYFEKALQINLKALGENHPEVAAHYNNLGETWNSKGEYDKAIEYYEKTLQINLNTLGDNHPTVAMNYNFLGLAWNSKGEYDKAIEYFEKALQINLKAFGENHSTIGTNYNNLGLALNSKKEYDKAIEYYEKSQKILEPTHPYQKTTADNLSRTANSRGVELLSEKNYQVALGYFQKALKNAQKAENVAFSISCLNNIGATQKNLQQYKVALETLNTGLQKASQINEEMKNLPLIRMQYHKVGCLKGLKRKKEAKTLAQELWQECVEANDTRTLEDLKKEGYDFGKN